MMPSTVLRAVLPALAAALFAGGCAIGPQPREQTASYDFGPPRAAPGAGPRFGQPLMVPPVAAPAWLDGTGIVYRLGYAEAARPRVYALSRWAAPPAALITQRVRSRFAAAGPVVTGSDGARAGYALRIEIDDFSQSFDAADRSRAVLRLRASLVDLATRALLAQRAFDAEAPAAPSAEGAAGALAAAADAAIENLLEWTARSLPPG
jgi:cholesterol transport system auxiliary component